MTGMRCIFCKCDSSNSKSVEHIIPESLGNKSHTLPKGIVCDSCNNYFATKIEKNLLESGYFKSLRYRNYVANKKGVVPMETAIIAHPEGGKIEVEVNGNILEAVIPSKRVYDLVSSGSIKRLYIPIYQTPEPDNIIISRFLAKVALEALAQRVSILDDWNEEFVTNDSLNPLRSWARFGEGSKIWHYHIRRIYDENHPFTDANRKYQILHEYDFILINRETFFLCAIFGMEYTINMGGDSVVNYLEWLRKNRDISPLQMTHDEKVSHNQSNQ